MRLIVTGCALIAALSALAACATAPAAPINAAPRLTADQLAGDPTIPYSEVIASMGAPTVASDAVPRGGVLVASGYRYKHTAT